MISFPKVNCFIYVAKEHLFILGTVVLVNNQINICLCFISNQFYLFRSFFNLCNSCDLPVDIILLNSEMPSDRIFKNLIFELHWQPFQTGNEFIYQFRQFVSVGNGPHINFDIILSHQRLCEQIHFLNIQRISSCRCFC